MRNWTVIGVVSFVIVLAAAAVAPNLVGNVLLGFSLIVFGWACVGLLKPQWGRIPHRLASVWIWAGSVGLFIFGAILIDPPETATDPPRREIAESPTGREREVTRRPARPPAEPSDGLTAAQRNAVRSANAYLRFSGFSRQGLIEQLSSDFGDGYNRGDATAAVDSLRVDWNEQAARSAATYLSMTGFSCKGLIEQLSSDAGDRYTVGQATHGATQAGAC